MVSITSCFVLLLCVVSAFSASISFNTTYASECTLALGGCSFFNASIWAGGVAPNATDDVSITLADTNATGVVVIPLITLNSAASVHSLTLANATLWVQENASVSIASSVTVGDQAQLTIGVNSTVVAASVTVVPTAVLLEVFGNLTTQNATFLGAVNVNAQDFIVADLVFGSSNINITNELLHFGLLLVSVNADVNVSLAGLQTSTLAVAENSNVYIAGIASLNTVQVAVNSSVTFLGLTAVGPSSSPLSGNGTVYVQQNASISGDSSNPVFEGVLFVQLTTTGLVSLHNMTLNHLLTFSSIGTNQTIEVDGVTLPGSTSVFGSFNVVRRGLTAGQVTLAQSLAVVQSTLTVSDYLAINIHLGVFSLQDSTFNLGGDVMGDLIIPANNTLKITEGNATVTGNFVNSGILMVSGDHYLNVVGNATLNHGGEVQASLTGKSDAVLFVNGGSLLVDGKLSYAIVKKSFVKDVNYLVAQANNGTVNGTFLNSTATALPSSQIDRDLDVSYTMNSVSIKYHWKVGDAQWWAWLILAIGIVVVLVVFIAIVVKCCRRRADYQPVR